MMDCENIINVPIMEENTITKKKKRKTIDNTNEETINKTTEVQIEENLVVEKPEKKKKRKKSENEESNKQNESNFSNEDSFETKKSNKKKKRKKRDSENIENIKLEPNTPEKVENNEEVSLSAKKKRKDSENLDNSDIEESIKDEEPTVDDGVDDDNEEEGYTNEKVNKKKFRKFHPKDFRNSLATKAGYESLKNFIQLCSETDSTQDYLSEYLDAGGNCSELLRVIESSTNKNASFVLPVIQAFNIVLLKIIASYPAKQLTVEESCRELLNKHYAVIKSMLSLSSNSKQRRIALKLLSTMVTLSPGLAKEVLTHASFDRSVLDVLTQPSSMEDGTSVRTAFIHFLISFLVEGNTATVVNFLEKRGLFGSIFSGLIYDKYDLVVLILTTVQSKILEDKLISKTIKMNTFNTQVVQNLVNLYNWKGPNNYRQNPKKNFTLKVDQEKKELVSESLHQFLLILCTSHRFGIIFHDPTCGLGAKQYNSLLLTVLQSLSKPWDHKYAGELILNICQACPDLVKYILKDIEPFLEPRVSVKWINVVNFVKRLIEYLGPKCVEQFLPQLNLKQISIIIQTFCVPRVVLQVITSDTILHQHIGVRHESILMLYTMIDSVEKYLNYVNSLTVFTPENKTTLKGLVVDYLNKNLPSASVVLSAWQMSVVPPEGPVDPTIPIPDLNEHLSKILDILYKYNTICPQLVDHITKELDTNQFLTQIEQISANNAEMQVKAINLLLICDNALFSPSLDLFEYVLPLLLKLYYINNENKLQLDIENTLYNIFSNTGIFEGCTEEIYIWLYAVLEQNSYNQNIGLFLTRVFKKTYKHFLKYITKLTTLQEETDSYNASDIIKNLQIDVDLGIRHSSINKYTILSPMILGFLDILPEFDSNSTEFINIIIMHLLHSQTYPNSLLKLLKERTNPVEMTKLYNYSNTIKIYNKYLTENSEIDCPQLTEWRHYYTKLITNFIMYYFTQLCLKQTITKTQQDKCLKILIFLLNKDATVVQSLNHPILLQSFKPDDLDNLCTDFVLEIIKELLKNQTKPDLEPYLHSYRIKIERCVHVKLKKSKKLLTPPNFTNIMSIITLIDLTQVQCSEILDSIADLSTKCFDNSGLLINVLNYCLNQTKLIPYATDTITKIAGHLLELNKTEQNLEELELNIFNYITKFPHSNISFNAEIFESLISKSNPLKSTCKLASILLKSNPETNLKKLEDNLDKIIDKRELIFSLLNQITSNSEGINLIFTKVYKQHEQIILKFLNKPQKVANYLIDNYEIIIKLLDQCMDEKLCNSFVQKSHKFDVSEVYHTEILTTVFMKNIKNNPDSNKVITNYFTTIMGLLINLLKRPEKSEEDWIKIEQITKLLTTQIIKIKLVYKIPYDDLVLLKSTPFQTFTKLCLKFGLQGKPDLINILKQFCQLTDSPNPDLAILFEMAISHSESLNILLGDTELKSSLVSLLLILCKKCPSVMIKSHIPVLLGAYQGTLSASDQSLLQLLVLYEKANIGFNEYRPYLWGKAAVGHYSVRFGVETTLWRQPKPREVLDILEEDKIINTITHFPRSRGLQSGESVYNDGETDVYDPAFYLPLLSHLLVPESTIRWFQCTQRGIIGLVIVALTSESSEIRSAACHVLARFHSHLEAASYGKQRLLWLHLVEVVCRGTSLLDNLRLSTIAAIFLARCALIFTRPNHPLYVALGHYIMAKECPDFTVIPELLPMLHSTDVSYTAHRNFILEVIRDGLRTENDIKIMFRSVAYRFIMDLHNSVLIDHAAQRIILEIISHSVAIPSAARTLITGYSLISWLYTLVHRFTSNDLDHIVIVLDIIRNVLNSYDQDIKYIQFNLLLIQLTLIEKLKDLRLNLEDLVKFLNNLYRIYECNPRVLNRTNLDELFEICSNRFDCSGSKYYLDYGCEFVQSPILKSNDLEEQASYYLKMLTLTCIKSGKFSENDENEENETDN